MNLADHAAMLRRQARTDAANRRLKARLAAAEASAREYRKVIERQRSTINAQAKRIGTTPIFALELPHSALLRAEPKGRA